MLKFVDLFSGIGGIRLGLEQALNKIGIESECLVSADIDKKACETYKLNFNENSNHDVYNISNIEGLDFLLAGFPCQPFSYAGEKRGFKDTRGTLFFEVERIIKESRPKGFLLENVRGLMSHDKGRTLKTIVSKLEGLGYGVEVYLLNSSDYGVPQNRVRVYIVGLDKGEKPLIGIKSCAGVADSHRFKSEKLDSLKNIKLVRDILEEKPDQKYYCTNTFTQQLSGVVSGEFEKLHGMRLIDYRGGNSIHSWELGLRGPCAKKEISFMNQLIANRRLKKFGADKDGKKLTLEQIKTFYKDKDINKTIKSLIKKGYLQITDNGGYNPKAGNMSFEVFKFLDPNSISITLVTSDAHRLGIVGRDGLPRRITPRECTRLQGFPDTFKLHPDDKATYRQLGNSVSVPVVELILFQLFKKYSDLLIPKISVQVKKTKDYSQQIQFNL